MIIDEQFRTLIPPLTADEYARLEENILKEGIRDKLVVWGETLIDGHNRFRIATENDLPYETVEMPFESREHALNWIISNQLGRRNLNPNQIAYLRGKRYENEKKIWGGQGGNRFTEKVESMPNAYSVNTAPKTSYALAEEYGVNPSTIQRDAQFSQVVDILPEEAKHNVLSGKDNITRSEAKVVIQMDKPTQKKFIQELESGTPIKEAVKKVDPEEKRRIDDENMRLNMKRQREMQERAKFNKWTYAHNDVIICGKHTFIENSNSISDKHEVWIMLDADLANKAKQILREQLNLKFN